MLYPGERHTYKPDEEGWTEYWIGFRGVHADEWIKEGFFSKEKPVLDIGMAASIVSLFEDATAIARQERFGCQQLLSGFVLHIIGEIYYRIKNVGLQESKAQRAIDEAKEIMKNNIDTPLNLEGIAGMLNVGYSWFRSNFKKYTGTSPAQYYQHLRYLRAKELLTVSSDTISEIAYNLNFQSSSQFSSFFSKKEGMTPKEYRNAMKRVSRQGKQ